MGMWMVRFEIEDDTRCRNNWHACCPMRDRAKSYTVDSRLSNTKLSNDVKIVIHIHRPLGLPIQISNISSCIILLINWLRHHTDISILVMQESD